MGCLSLRSLDASDQSSTLTKQLQRRPHGHWGRYCRMLELNMQAFSCPPYGQPNDQREGRPGSCTVARRAARVTTSARTCIVPPRRLGTRNQSRGECGQKAGVCHALLERRKAGSLIKAANKAGGSYHPRTWILSRRQTRVC